MPNIDVNVIGTLRRKVEVLNLRWMAEIDVVSGSLQRVCLRVGQL